MHRILLLADLHIGSIKDISYTYNVITEIFDKELIKNKTGAVVILGDYFDRLMKTNEEFVSLSINVMTYLVKLCKINKIKIRMIYGTESHEMSQYRLFNYHLTESKVDFKIIDSVISEELLPGVNVLYIPEEYIESKNDHYKEYLYSDNKYDYVFGHGVITEGMPMLKFDIGSKSNEKKVPHFKSAELQDVCKFYAFGHYHVHTELEGGCYVGSPFRNSFGEEESKGYGIIENGMFSFIENKRAYVFKTYTFPEKSKIYIGTEYLIKEIKKIKQENVDIFSEMSYGKIRLLFQTPIDVDTTFKESLRSILFDEKYISVLIKGNTEEVLDGEDVVEDEDAWILDNSLPTEDKIHRFINKSYETSMTLKELTTYINEPLTV